MPHLPTASWQIIFGGPEVERSRLQCGFGWTGRVHTCSMAELCGCDGTYPIGTATDRLCHFLDHLERIPVIPRDLDPHFAKGEWTS